MIDQVERAQPVRIVELGGGKGALLSAALKRWTNANAATVDIDSSNIEYMRSHLPGVVSAKLDITSASFISQFEKNLNLSLSDFDLMISNPPYVQIKWQRHFTRVLRKAGFLEIFANYASLDASIIFLAQYLGNSSVESHTAVIVPDSIVSNYKLKDFRDLLISEYGLYKIISLPRGIFRNTNVKTHILYMSKREICNNKLSILNLNNDLTIDKIEVDKSDEYQRLDYDYVVMENGYTQIGAHTLGSLATIKRGNINNTTAKKKAISVFHTTSFREVSNGIIESQDDVLLYDKVIYAMRGDILIGRVGRSISSQKALVKRGVFPVSDCIIIVRPNRIEESELLFQEINASSCTDWLESRIKGTGAKSITMRDVAEMPMKKGHI